SVADPSRPLPWPPEFRRRVVERPLSPPLETPVRPPSPCLHAQAIELSKAPRILEARSPSQSVRAVESPHFLWPGAPGSLPGRNRLDPQAFGPDETECFARKYRRRRRTPWQVRENEPAPR